MDLLKKLAKYVNIKGLVIDFVLREIVKPKLEELVARTDNKLDDALVGIIYPELEEFAGEQVAKALGEMEAEAAPADDKVV